MGKGLAFLNLKFFHPGNKENQRRKWEALQRDAERQRKIKERELELEQEKQVHETRKMLFEQEMGANSTEYRKELLKEEVAWLYNVPPGLKKQIEKERKKVEEETRLKEWQQAMEHMTREERRFAEKEMETGLSVHERNVRRFEFLKNAPMVADYVKDMEVTHKPFGKVVRNVRCIKCGKWGHRINDRECTMNGYNPLFSHPEHENNSSNNHNQKKNKNRKKEEETENQEVSVKAEGEAAEEEKVDRLENEKITIHDPLNKMKSKLIHKHLQRYEGDETAARDEDMQSMMETRSMFTLNPDQSSANAKVFSVKSFERNDGTKWELLEDEEENDYQHEMEPKRKKRKLMKEDKDRKEKKKKRKKKSKRDEENDEEDDDIDYKYIMSLPKEKRLQLLQEIEQREKRRKKSRKKSKSKKKKAKHRDKSEESLTENEENSENETDRHSKRRHKRKGHKKRSRRSRSPSTSRSRSRSRSRDRDRERNKKRHRSHRR